jgi:membrane protein DedA with SNARE-associated domain
MPVPVASILSGVTDAVTSVVGDYGLYAVFLLMAVDALFPVASEVVMIYAGALASGAFAGQSVVLFGTTVDSGVAAYLAVALAGTLGYTLGAIVGWVIGRYGGHPYLERHGRWLHVDAEALARAERWFARWEDWAVFLGRLTPVVRSFISIPAGVLEVPFVRYTALTLAGSAIWCFTLGGAGYAAGASWETLHRAFGFLDYVIVAGVVAALALLVVRRLRRRRRAAEEPSSQ